MRMLEPVVDDIDHKPKLIHHNQLYGQHITDEHWMDHCKKHRWLPITSDNSKSRHGSKLSDVCRSVGWPHVVISSKLSQSPASVIARGIISVWGRLADAWQVRGGSKYLLHFTNERKGFALKKE